MVSWVLREVRRILELFGPLHPRSLAEALGLEVLRAPFARLRGAALAGLPLPDGGASDPCVVLSDGLGDREELGVLLHEIGERLLHPRWNWFFANRATLFRPAELEREAWLFALFYLMEWDGEGLEWDFGGDLIAFARSYGVPPEAAEAAARILGRAGPPCGLGRGSRQPSRLIGIDRAPPDSGAGSRSRSPGRGSSP